ncbi:MAG: hypothetical protein DWQ07_26035 [Chloroflexi bacterium]|nr:MAG: hypothetical protein DWQ07_26035 [Chloroflexota bacterium]
MNNIHIQAFSKDEDNNPPGFHIGVASSVLEKYGDDGEAILLMLLSEIEGYFVGHYLFKFSNREPDGYSPHFTEHIKEAPLEN